MEYNLKDSQEAFIRLGKASAKSANAMRVLEAMIRKLEPTKKWWQFWK